MRALAASRECCDCCCAAETAPPAAADADETDVADPCVGQVAALGEHTWDGQGKTVATNTISANGTILHVTVTGTYTVNADCTASLAESDGSHYRFVVAPDGNTASWIEIDPGTVVSGTEARLKPTDDN